MLAIGSRLTVISRSSRNLIPGTPGDDVLLLRVFGAAALAKPRCQSLARKPRHTAAESAPEVDKVVDKVLIVFSMVCG